MKPYLALILGAGLVAGCASTSDDQTQEAKSPRVYRTGSNIPVKDDSPPATPEERARTIEEIRAITQPKGMVKTPGGSN